MRTYLCNIGQRNTVSCRFDENVWKWLLLPLIVFIIFKLYYYSTSLLLYSNKQVMREPAYRIGVHVFVIPIIFPSHFNFNCFFVAFVWSVVIWALIMPAAIFIMQTACIVFWYGMFTSIHVIDPNSFSATINIYFRSKNSLIISLTHLHDTKHHRSSKIFT